MMQAVLLVSKEDSGSEIRMFEVDFQRKVEDLGVELLQEHREVKLLLGDLGAKLVLEDSELWLEALSAKLE